MPIKGENWKDTVKKTMAEHEEGGLHSGKGGPTVPKTEEGYKQAYAIGMSYARRAGQRPPRNRKLRASYAGGR